ncbi:MAG: PEGA domain-containing protein, partial [Proteobacteria bacterium]|nr:PEGA domain-containing protein [Pseudomonadota bacterium]
MFSRLMIIATCLSASPALADLAGQEKDNYYASGQAQADTQIAAERAACDNAKRELISYVFGLSTKVNSNFVQTLDKVHLTQTVDVNSDWLSLKGLQQTLSSTTDEKGMLISECRILYSLAEAKLEKSRIDKARALLEREKLNRASFENSDPVNFGRLTVRSNAPKTKVFLDGVHWGWAPLEVDRVPVGEHQVSLSADGYVTDAMGIDLKIGEAKVVFVAMKKNLAKLQLLNLPARSTVWINGLKSSASRYDLDPGEVIIRVEAPYYMPYQDALTLAAGANLEHSIHMVAKPIPVSFVSKGEKADVFINGASIGKTPISKDLVLGDYSVDFMTAAGIIHKTNLTVTPGAKLSVVAPPAPKSSSASARLSPVVLYKDSSLSVR